VVLSWVFLGSGGPWVFSFYVDGCGVLNVIYVELCVVHSLHCLHV
jgi:hypothetical protein